MNTHSNINSLIVPACIIFFGLSAHTLVAQSANTSEPPQVTTDNAMYLELAIIFFCASISINYEHSLSRTIWLRAGYGIGGIQGLSKPGSWGTGPMLMGMYLSGDDHKFELGFGGSLIYGYLEAFEKISPSHSYREHSDWWLIPAVSLGYRYQPLDGGVLFRSGLTFDYYGGFPIQFSLGYAF